MTDRAKIARTNKRNSRKQEKRLAEYFGGNVVPLSGSGNIKGDIIIPFDDMRNIYGECKLTKKDTLSVEHAWLDKIRAEYRLMRCMFGVLLITFIKKPELDFVVISPEGLTILAKHGILPMYHFKGLANTKTFPVERNGINSHYIISNNEPWLLVPIQIFKDWLENIAQQSQEN